MLHVLREAKHILLQSYNRAAQAAVLVPPVAHSVPSRPSSSILGTRHSHLRGAQVERPSLAEK